MHMLAHTSFPTPTSSSHLELLLAHRGRQLNGEDTTMNGRPQAVAGDAQPVNGPNGNASGPSRERKDKRLPDATDDDLAVVRNLCQIVARLFYADQHAIVIDILSRHTVCV